MRRRPRRSRRSPRRSRRRGREPVPRERTFVLLKPDAVHRGLVGTIVHRFERRGLKLVGMKAMRVSKGLAETYYAEHKGKPFFEGLVKYVTSSPVVAIVLEGDGAVAVVRRIIGQTNLPEEEPSRILRHCGLQLRRNVTHGPAATPSP